MKAKDVPPFHKALTDLAAYFPTFYDAFESGHDNAKGILEQLGDSSVDPWLHAHLVRHSVKLFLQKHDVDAREYKPENLAMSGLQFCVGCWFIRARKSARGAVPSPGRSSTLSAYYRQLTLPGEFSEMHNLLMLWHTNLAGDFQRLTLVYPLAPGMMKWKGAIPHPAKAIDEATTISQPDFEDLGDLDIEPLTEGDEFLTEGDEDSEAEGQ